MVSRMHQLDGEVGRHLYLFPVFLQKGRTLLATSSILQLMPQKSSTRQKKSIILPGEKKSLTRTNLEVFFGKFTKFFVSLMVYYIENERVF
jgi:hypothetical protein